MRSQARHQVDKVTGTMAIIQFDQHICSDEHHIKNGISLPSGAPLGTHPEDVGVMPTE